MNSVRQPGQSVIARVSVALNMALGFLILSGCTAATERPPVERAFINGIVWTGVEGAAPVEALGVSGDRIVFAGSTEDVRALTGEMTQIVDLGGRLVVPGFNDAHWHFMAAPQTAFYGADSLDVFQQRLRDLAARPSGSEWIINSGWAYSDFPDNIPHKDYIDEIVPDRPVWIMARDGHMGLANSMALEIAGIRAETPDLEQGRYIRDANGDLTGELTGRAVSTLVDILPKPGLEDAVIALNEDFALAASYGITSVQIASELGAVEMEALQQVVAGGNSPVRIQLAVALELSPDEDRLARIEALRSQYNDIHVRCCTVKGHLDGTIDAQTGWMLANLVGGGTGFGYWNPEDLNDAAAFYDSHGFQLMLHATGDAAIMRAIDATANASDVNGPRDRRFRIEHLDIPRPEDLVRMRELGMIASSQPNFAYPDETNLTNYARLLGPARMLRAQSYRSINEAGVRQTFSSDFPVSSMDVTRALYTAVTRQTLSGEPEGGWYPEQRISIEAALRHYTVDGAYASFEEAVKGTLEVGKLADFAVLSENILEIDPSRIFQSKVQLTVKGGKITYKSEDWLE